MEKSLQKLWFIVLFVFVLTLLNCSVAIGSGAFNPLSQESGALREIVKSRTENSKTFLMKDGKHKVFYYNVPIHFWSNEKKCWLPINSKINSLKEESYKRIKSDTAQKEFAYQVTQNRFNTYFPANTSKEIKLSHKGYDVKLRQIKGKNVKAEVCPDNPNAIYYRGVWKDTDLEYKVSENGLKENIIVQKNPDYSILSSRINIKGLTPVEDRSLGGYKLIDKNGYVVFRIPQAIAFEEKNSKDIITLESQFTRDGDDWVYSIRIDKAWFNSEERNYPVVIDPVVLVPWQSYTGGNSFLVRSGANTTLSYEYQFSKIATTIAQNNKFYIKNLTTGTSTKIFDNYNAQSRTSGSFSMAADTTYEIQFNPGARQAYINMPFEYYPGYLAYQFDPLGEGTSTCTKMRYPIRRTHGQAIGYKFRLQGVLKQTVTATPAAAVSIVDNSNNATVTMDTQTQTYQLEPDRDYTVTLKSDQSQAVVAFQYGTVDHVRKILLKNSVRTSTTITPGQITLYCSFPKSGKLGLEYLNLTSAGRPDLSSSSSGAFGSYWVATPVGISFSSDGFNWSFDLGTSVNRGDYGRWINVEAGKEYVLSFVQGTSYKVSTTYGNATGRSNFSAWGSCESMGYYFTPNDALSVAETGIRKGNVVVKAPTKARAEDGFWFKTSKSTNTLKQVLLQYRLAGATNYNTRSVSITPDPSDANAAFISGVTMGQLMTSDGTLDWKVVVWDGYDFATGNGIVVSVDVPPLQFVLYPLNITDQNNMAVNWEYQGVSGETAKLELYINNLPWGEPRTIDIVSNPSQQFTGLPADTKVTAKMTLTGTLETHTTESYTYPNAVSLIENQLNLSESGYVTLRFQDRTFHSLKVSKYIKNGMIPVYTNKELRPGQELVRTQYNGSFCYQWVENIPSEVHQTYVYEITSYGQEGANPRRLIGPNQTECTIPNRPPLIKDLKVISDIDTMNITLQVDAQDPDNDQLTYQYELTDKQNVTFSIPSYTWNSLEVKAYHWKVTVTDGHGGIDTRSGEVGVNEWRKLIIDTKDHGGRGSKGQPLSFSTRGPATIQLSEFVWDFGDGTPTTSGAEATHAYAELSNPNVPYVVTVSAKDAQGNTYIGSTTVQICNTTKGRLYTNEVWTGNHIVEGEIIVPEGVTLSIGPNANITVQDNCYIKVYGTLTMNNATITSSTQWKGIRFMDKGSGQLNGGSIQGAERGVACTSNGQVIITGTEFVRNNTGVHCFSGQITITSCSFTENVVYGIKEDANCNPLVQGCTFLRNGVDYYDAQALSGA